MNFLTQLNPNMKLNRKSILVLLAIVFSSTIWAQTIFTQWTFESNPLLIDDATPGAEVGQGVASIVGSMTTPGAATGSATGCAQSTGTRAWALGTANPGTINESSGAQFLFSTEGYQNIKFNFDQRFSNTAVRTVRIQYTLDGTAWNNLDVDANNFTSGCANRSGIDLGRIDVSEPVGNNISDAWVRRSVDFSAISGANNNPNFGVRVVAAHYGNTGEFRQANNINNLATAGTWRFDNVSVEGDALPQEQLVHYWNFNALPSGTLTAVTPNISLVPSGTQITYPGTGAGYMDNVNPGSAINARNGDPVGLGLRPRNPSNTREFLIAANTQGFENIKIKFATTKTNQGATEQIYDYSLDGGISYLSTDLALTLYNPLNEPNYELVSHDLSAIAGVEDNENFIFRIRFGGTTAAGSSGNNRFDNITVEGTPISGAVDLIAPTVTFNPANNTTGVATSVTPTITFSEDVRLVNNIIIDNNSVDALVELRLNDVTGALVPFDATFANNVITIVPDAALQFNQQYYVALLPNVVEDLSDNAVATLQSVVFTTQEQTFATKISFTSNFLTVNEDAGTIDINLSLIAPDNASVDLVLKGAPFSTADANDFTFTTQTLNFTSGSSATQTITIPIIDDNDLEQAAEYFVLTLENPVGLNILGNSLATIYIKDNDRVAPVPTNDIELLHVGSFDPSSNNTATCEIVVHDPQTQRLFATSAITGFLDIIDFSNPASLSVITSIDINPYGGITSVAVKNGIVAVASPNVNEELDGSVVFLDTDGNFLKQVTVGALPDMITFSPDGNKVITANEGQPTINYSFDPEGSVSIIDVSGGIANLSQANVTTLLFTAFNSQEAALIASGVRKLKLTSTLSQDFEPEYVAVSNDSKKAWVTLQENNAIAEIDLDNLIITDVWALGTKDFNAAGNGFDAIDNNGQVLIANWPVKAFYIPDAIAQYNVGGVTYLVTANEGDEKEYTGFEERTTVGSNNYALDPVAFPHAAMLKASHNLGRFRVSNLNGDTDGDGDFDEIYCVGSRSFSIWNADTKTLVYDSGDDFELYTSTAPSISALFNADHSSNTAKNRSRAKGPEPEGVVTGEISGKTYAFISFERIGGVMVYDVTNPADVKFVDYKNTRTTAALGGDLGAEGIIFISKNESPDGKNYIALSNEISGTITIFEIQDNNPSIVVNAPSLNSFCVGDSITVDFTTNNITFNNGNEFEVILSDSDGNFPGVILGTTEATPFKGVIPVNSDAGNNYKLKVTSSNPAYESTTVSISVNELPEIDLGNDTTLCVGTDFEIESTTFNNYEWSTGETTASITVTTTDTYTLTVTDNNNCKNNDAITITFDVCSSVDNMQNILTVNIYPNPTKSVLNISVKQNNAESVAVKLLSLDGKVLMQTESEAAEFVSTMNVSSLSGGIYLLQIKTNSELHTKKIILQ
mgnify:CR=1 FL=1